MLNKWRKLGFATLPITGTMLLLATATISCSESTADSSLQTNESDKRTNDKTNTFDPQPLISAAKVPSKRINDVETLHEILNGTDEAGALVKDRIYARYLWVAHLKGDTRQTISAEEQTSGVLLGENFTPSSPLLGVETSGVPAIVTGIVAEIVNRVWQIDVYEQKLNSKILIDEFLRMSNASILDLLPFLNILRNYENHQGELSAHPEWAVGYSWNNILHFTRLALAKTPESVYEFEPLLAMLSPFGKDKITIFNENIARPYVVEPVSKKPIGGHGGKKLNLAPRLEKINVRKMHRS